MTNDEREQDAREALDALRLLHGWATRACRDIGALDERIRCDIAAATLRAALLPSPPATDGDMKEGDSWLVGTHSDEEESPSKGTRTVPPE